MISSALLKRKAALTPQTLEGRKQQLQLQLTKYGSLVAPTVPVIEPKKATATPKASQQQQQPKRRIYNISARDQVTARVELPKPNSSGQLITKLTGVIQGKVIYLRNEVLVQFKRSDTSQMVKVRGCLPVVDTGLVYTIEARQVWQNAQQIYIFERICENGLVALPVNGHYFREFLRKRMAMDSEIATAVALQVASEYLPPQQGLTPLQKLKETEIPISHIYENFKDHLWYPELCEKWGRLRYKFYPELLLFWKYEELSRLSLSDLEMLHVKLRENPMHFCFTDYRSGRLSPLKEEKFHLFRDILNVEFSSEMCSLVKFFNAFSKEITETKCLAVPMVRLESIAESVCLQHRNDVIRLALKHKLIQGSNETFLEEDPNRIGQSMMRFYRFQDLMDLRSMRANLNRIMARPANCIEPLEGVTIPRLKKEQRAAIKAITKKVNIVMLSGDGGTGKTLTSKAVYQLYGGVRCLAVAAYTALASRNQTAFSGRDNDRGMTIDLVIESIVRKTKQGLRIVEFTEVLILDEAGIVPMEKFSKLLALLPSLKKIFMTGDVKQCRPVTAGRVLDGFVEAWKGTDQLLYLTKNRRVDPAFQVLVQNFSHFLKGEFSAMSFTNDMLSDIPFKVIKRQDYSKLGDDEKARGEMMLRELKPIFYSLKPLNVDSSQIRIIAHTHNDVELLNKAWMSLNRVGQRYTETSDVFFPGDLVRFTEPFTHTYRGKKTIVPYHLKCDNIQTNNVAQIHEIYDISSTETAVMAYKNRKILPSTGEEFVSGDTCRMISFTNGKKLNLRDYNLCKIVPGHASTILSTIGHEADYVIVWVSSWQKHFYRDLMYTAITRARKGVYLIMDISDDMDLAKSDLARIWTHLPPATENIIAGYVPKIGVAEVDSIDRILQNLPDFEKFVFNPTSELEKSAFEETMRDFEFNNPIINENAYLERETERILKHNAIKRAESQLTLDMDDDLSGSFGFDMEKSNVPISRARTVIDLDKTQTLDVSLELHDDKPSPKPLKRHFGWIAERKQKLNEKKISSSESFESAPKRLKRHPTTEVFDVEEIDTLLEAEDANYNTSNKNQSLSSEESDPFEFEGNPFDFIRKRRVLADDN